MAMLPAPTHSLGPNRGGAGLMLRPLQGAISDHLHQLVGSGREGRGAAAPARDLFVLGAVDLLPDWPAEMHNLKINSAQKPAIRIGSGRCAKPHAGPCAIEIGILAEF